MSILRAFATPVARNKIHPINQQRQYSSKTSRRPPLYRLAAISNGLTPLIINLGVDLPTQAASNQWVLAKFC